MKTTSNTCNLCPFKNSNPPRYVGYEGYAKKQIPNVRIKILFIAESPPNPEPSEMHNLPYIFNPKYLGGKRLGLLRVLNPTNPNLKIETKEEKRKLLDFAKRSGYYLLDAARCPVNQLRLDPIRDEIVKCCAEKFLYAKIKKLDSKPGIDRIIIVKTTVYRALRQRMKSDFCGKLVERELPFPGVWHERTFTGRLSEIISDLGLCHSEPNRQS